METLRSILRILLATRMVSSCLFKFRSRLNCEIHHGGSNKYPAINYSVAIRACHLKTKINLLRLIYSRRVVDEMPVDQFIFKLFPPALYVCRRTRESFAESMFRTTGEANEYPLFCFSVLAHVEMSRNAEMAGHLFDNVA